MLTKKALILTIKTGTKVPLRGFSLMGNLLADNRGRRVSDNKKGFTSSPGLIFDELNF
ncbi:hypothetical protein RSc0957 [Ralstonia pseudosolanacearum GMI1000]|uniref:Uncharacterized protein n=1 Tax=Ralstonia nicotianae (strain ATCC BAA-1114 / GMI1000) TaxID=267608 RepID=Q8Y0T6_RALN1|nr:hypothetical protein RSc0957 [Ralstonia pseudosolanacearum GMI1000]